MSKPGRSIYKGCVVTNIVKLHITDFFSMISTSMVSTVYFRQNEALPIANISAIEQVASVRARELLRLKQKR